MTDDNPFGDRPFSNGSGSRPSMQDIEGTVIHFPAEKDRRQGGGRGPRKPREPFLNLPPFTGIMLMVFFGIHLVTALLPETLRDLLFMNFGFTPGQYTGVVPFSWTALLSPFTYAFLHGSWFHFGMNAAMFLAFASPVERWLGTRRLFLSFLACSLAGAFVHALFNPFSPAPLVGASAGISGLFAFVLVVLNDRIETMNRMAGGILRGTKDNRLMKIALLWIGITILTGVFSMATGAAISWESHLGGFLCGFLIVYLGKKGWLP